MFQVNIIAENRSRSKGRREKWLLPDEHVIPAGGEIPQKASTPSGSIDDSEQKDKISVGSNESVNGSKKETNTEQSKIGAFIDKAKRKGHKLVSSRKKNVSECAADISPHASVKSLDSLSKSEERIASRRSSGGSAEHLKQREDDIKEQEEKKKDNLPIERKRVNQTLVDPADPSDPFLVQSLIHKFRVLPFFRARLIVFGTLVALTIASPGFFTGLIWGFYSTIIGFLYFFVSEPKPKEDVRDRWFDDEDVQNVSSSSVDKIDDQGFGLGEGVVYRGWMNELRTRYSPANYHVNSSQSVLVRLEGSMLRICRPAKAVLKHAFYDDPTLKQSQPSMVSQVIYDLKDAQVSLRPKRLARRRWWSRKYPIHIRFAHSSSSLVEIDHSSKAKSRGMTRSASMAPHPNISESNEPIASDEDSDGYTAESETEGDDSTADKRKRLRANSASDINEFKESKTNKKRGRSVFLFVRAAREKERWFHLLREACARARNSPKVRRCMSVIVKTSSSASLPGEIRTNEEEMANASVAIEALAAENDDFSESVFNTPERNRLPKEYEFLKYRSNYASFVKEISSILSVQIPPCPEKNSTVSVDLGTMKWAPGAQQISSELVDSINVLATRIFFDFCRDDFWIRQVKQKIQSKLATIHLPYFIEKLELGELKFGTKAPRFTAVYTPKVDEWGTWVDFEMKYKGGIRLVLQTSVNLLKLQSGALQVNTEKRVNRWTESVRVNRYSDSDLPESPESSPDEDFGAKNNSEGTTKEKTGKKILSIVERAAQSSLFQKAAKLHAVARLIEDVSTTPLMLNVEVEEVEGPMTCNIPPPPSDRLWYAFRRKPILKIRAVPQVGDRSVDLSTVSEWIETKLRQVLEKNLVCPNMDDIILPVLSGNALLHMGYNK
uniref:SMP-LTD domain-containing protein n=1 Tax=Caenorhabditis japonica TaxID=281687 RepID=A0A8R1HS30_CAEJA